MKNIADVIIAPIVTEDSTARIADKKYTFKVQKDATKPEIALAVETMFKGAKVDKVNTMNMKRKPKRLGMHAGYTSAWKKAIVTLPAESKPIEFFEGMAD